MNIWASKGFAERVRKKKKKRIKEEISPFITATKNDPNADTVANANTATPVSPNAVPIFITYPPEYIPTNTATIATPTITIPTAAITGTNPAAAAAAAIAAAATATTTTTYNAAAAATTTGPRDKIVMG